MSVILSAVGLSHTAYTRDQFEKGGNNNGAVFVGALVLHEGAKEILDASYYRLLASARQSYRIDVGFSSSAIHLYAVLKKPLKVATRKPEDFEQKAIMAFLP